MGLLEFVLGLLRGNTHVAVSFAGKGPSGVQELQAILMVPNVALFPPGEVPEQPKKERNKKTKI